MPVHKTRLFKIRIIHRTKAWKRSSLLNFNTFKHSTLRYVSAHAEKLNSRSGWIGPRFPQPRPSISAQPFIFSHNAHTYQFYAWLRRPTPNQTTSCWNWNRHWITYRLDITILLPSKAVSKSGCTDTSSDESSYNEVPECFARLTCPSALMLMYRNDRWLFIHQNKSLTVWYEGHHNKQQNWLIQLFMTRENSSHTV